MASTMESVGTGFYLYGITTAEAALPMQSRGVAEGGVESVVEGPLAAIVTRVAVRNIRPERANLAAHNQVLRDLADRDAVLPVAFGTVVDSEQELRRAILRNSNNLIDRLRLLQDKVEVVLKVYWDTPNIYEYFMTTHAELQQMRDRLFASGRKPSRSQSIELGEMFAAMLQQARERHTSRVTDALSEFCAEIRTVNVGEEKMIMKLACLVEKDRVERWEEGVHEIARLFDNNYSFKYGNPSIPFNFTDVDLELGGNP